MTFESTGIRRSTQSACRVMFTGSDRVSHFYCFRGEEKETARCAERTTLDVSLFARDVAAMIIAPMLFNSSDFE